MSLRRPELGLRVLSFALAFALLVVVHGERRVATTFAVPVEAQDPASLPRAAALPASLRVSVSGPWARLRSLHASDLGPVAVDLSRTGTGVASWSARPESLHLPPGVRVESVFPSQGTLELLRERP